MNHLIIYPSYLSGPHIVVPLKTVVGLRKNFHREFFGRMAELADARGLGPRGATRGGSTPLPPIVLFDRAEEELKRACKLGIQVDATLRERRLTVEQANGRPGVKCDEVGDREHIWRRAPNPVSLPVYSMLFDGIRIEPSSFSKFECHKGTRSFHQDGEWPTRSQM